MSWIRESVKLRGRSRNTPLLGVITHLPSIRLPCLFLYLVLGFLITSWPAAQENDDCFMCHEDPDLTGMRAGQEIPVFVDPQAYTGSVHADLSCALCHQDLADTELPHAEEVEPVDCGLCHDQQAEEHADSLHGRARDRGDQLAPRCADCHGRHDIRPAADPDSPISLLNIPLLCGRCHHEGSPVSLTHEIPQERILENYSLSIHGEA